MSACSTMQQQKPVYRSMALLVQAEVLNVSEIYCWVSSYSYSSSICVIISFKFQPHLCFPAFFKFIGVYADFTRITGVSIDQSSFPLGEMYSGEFACLRHGQFVGITEDSLIWLRFQMTMTKAIDSIEWGLLYPSVV